MKLLMLYLLKYGIDQVESFSECIFHLAFMKYSKKETTN